MLGLYGKTINSVDTQPAFVLIELKKGRLQGELMISKYLLVIRDGLYAADRGSGNFRARL